MTDIHLPQNTSSRTALAFAFVKNFKDATGDKYYFRVHMAKVRFNHSAHEAQKRCMPELDEAYARIKGEYGPAMQALAADYGLNLSDFKSMTQFTDYLCKSRCASVMIPSGHVVPFLTLSQMYEGDMDVFIMLAEDHLAMVFDKEQSHRSKQQAAQKKNRNARAALRTYNVGIDRLRLRVIRQNEALDELRVRVDEQKEMLESKDRNIASLTNRLRNLQKAVDAVFPPRNPHLHLKDLPPLGNPTPPHEPDTYPPDLPPGTVICEVQG